MTRRDLLRAQDTDSSFQSSKRLTGVKIRGGIVPSSRSQVKARTQAATKAFEVVKRKRVALGVLAACLIAADQESLAL